MKWGVKMFNIPMNTTQASSLSALCGSTSSVAPPRTLDRLPNPTTASSPAQPAPVQRQPAPAAMPRTAPRRSGGTLLRKGQKSALVSVDGQNLEVFKMGFFWGVANPSYDIDVECFMLGENGKVLGDDWFVFYSSLVSPDGAVAYSGTETDPQLPEDNKVLAVDLQRVDSRVKKIVFVMTIDRAKELGLNFSGVRSAGSHVVDCRGGAEVYRFELTEYYETVTSMVIGEIYRHNGQWKFNPVGDGTASDLAELCKSYGVTVG